MGVERRPHYKTRTGCTTCKKRRIKCDERKPVCENCSRRSIECSFQSVVPSGGGPSSYPSPPDGDETSSSASGGSPFEFTVEDMELMHLWSTNTSATISIQSVWQGPVTTLALSYPFLLRSMLALTALHKAYLLQKETSSSPTPTGHTSLDEHYLSIAARHQNLALNDLRDALTNITRENAPAVLNFSSFNFMFTLGASRHYGTLTSYFKGQQTDNTIHWLRFHHGIRVLSPYWKWIEESPVKDLMPSRDLLRPCVPETPEEEAIDAQLATISEIWTSDTTLTSEEHDALQKSWEKLRHCFLVSSQLSCAITWKDNRPFPDNNAPEKYIQTFIAAIITWLHWLDPPFVQLADRQNVAALVVFAHYGVLMQRLHFLWVFEDVPREIITAVAEHLGEDKRHLVDWPVEQLNTAVRERMDLT